jgi:two-component system, chemotaxis family, chemotaxis protein CheY
MPVRVMVVDDIEMMRNALKEILHAHDMQLAAEAKDGKEAVSRYLEKKPDVVLMDITMPRMNGIEALRRILQLDPQAKVIMCSALSGQKHILRAIQIGAGDFIVKPAHPKRVVSAIEKVLGIEDAKDS